ncbi:MAG: RNA polymerase factor sigma-32 [Bdellovibrionaceae bacterium]|nr:RNA polymerase factor sigma-32 [Pseudobdellovibrionaceae bacterium]
MSKSRKKTPTAKTKTTGAKKTQKTTSKSGPPESLRKTARSKAKALPSDLKAETPVQVEILTPDSEMPPTKALPSKHSKTSSAVLTPKTSGSIERTGSTEEVSPKDTLSLYLQQIRQYPVLSREQELALAQKYYEDNDAKAAETLVKSNLRFVVKIALEYSKFGSRVIDLIQEGNMGLMHAVREYNPYKGVRLISYAVWWIRGYIQDYLMKQQSIVKIGTNQKQRKLFYQLEKEKNRLLQEGLDSTPKLLSQRLDVTEKDVVEMEQRLERGDLSLDQKISEDNDQSWLDRQTENDSESLDESFINAEQLSLLKEKIDGLMPELNEREIELLNERLLNDEPVTLKSLGDKWGVTREAARQAETRLIEKIKKAFLES